MTVNQNCYLQTLIVETEDVYEDFSSNKEMFDFKNYENKLVIVKIKDETRDVVSEVFVGLLPKM